MPRIPDEVVGQDENRRGQQGGGEEEKGGGRKRRRCPPLVERGQPPRRFAGPLVGEKILAGPLGARHSGTEGLVRGHCRRRRSRMDRSRSRGSLAAGGVFRV